MAEMTYCTGMADGGFICPMLKHCARATREPAEPEKGYDVFAVPPYQVALKVCNFFWPEGNPGLTEMTIPPDTVIHMGGGDSPHPSGMEVFEESDGQYAFVEPEEDQTMGDLVGATTELAGAAFNLKVPLWPTGEEQDEVFQKLVLTLDDIETFSAHCVTQRNTDPVEVWLLLTGIKARMERLIYPPDGPTEIDDD